jgi:hypothetical protein
VLCLSLLDGLLDLDWAWVLHFLDIKYLVVAKAIHVNFLMLVQVGSSDIAIDRYGIIFFLLLILNHVESICDDIGVVKSPAQGLDLLNGDESTQIVNLSLWVVAISLLATEVE